jgi:predicted ribosomally synthesized peptide with nif11-like leader
MVFTVDSVLDCFIIQKEAGISRRTTMSQQGMIKLIRMAESNEALLQELQQAGSLEEQVAIARRHGCDVTVEELAALSALARKDAGETLSDAELELASGGSIWSSIKGAAKWVYKHVYVDVKNAVVGGKGTF